MLYHPSVTIVTDYPRSLGSPRSLILALHAAYVVVAGTLRFSLRRASLSPGMKAPRNGRVPRAFYAHDRVTSALIFLSGVSYLVHALVRFQPRAAHVVINTVVVQGRTAVVVSYHTLCWVYIDHFYTLGLSEVPVEAVHAHGEPHTHDDVGAI